MTAIPVVPSRGRLRPLELGEVEITGGEWATRQAVNAEATLAHAQGWMERLGWIDNFTRVAAGDASDHQGMVFADSDVYKLMEAMAWEVGRSGSADADQRFRGLTEVIAPVQEPDGYLNTVFGRPGQRPRYSDLEWGHELYNYGHLLQAAVARARTTGSDGFVDLALRVADHVCDTFGAGASSGSVVIPRSSSGSSSSPAKRVGSAISTRRPCSCSGGALGRSGRSLSVRRTSRTMSRFATPRCSVVMPCGRCISPPEQSTSPSRPVTTSCSPC